jgi:peptidyl-prolyl cis-trans isomerase A (cyclophilin A)
MNANLACSVSLRPRTALVELTTDLGILVIEVEVTKAPDSAGAFLAVVEDGRLVRCGAFFRAVRSGVNDSGREEIDIVQAGLFEKPGEALLIPHEPTSATGLTHQRGAVSLARGQLGATGTAFFICLDDAPGLDAGGARDPFGDGKGFAMFGRVVAGMEVATAIHMAPRHTGTSAHCPDGQQLDPFISIVAARCLPDSTVPVCGASR